MTWLYIQNPNKTWYKKINNTLGQWIGKGGNKTQYAKFKSSDFTACTWEVTLMDSAVQSLIYIKHHDYIRVLNKQLWLIWEQINRMLKQMISNHLLIAASVIYNQSLQTTFPNNNFGIYTTNQGGNLSTYKFLTFLSIIDKKYLIFDCMCQ